MGRKKNLPAKQTAQQAARKEWQERQREIKAEPSSPDSSIGPVPVSPASYNDLLSRRLESAASEQQETNGNTTFADFPMTSRSLDSPLRTVKPSGSNRGRLGATIDPAFSRLSIKEAKTDAEADRIMGGNWRQIWQRWGYDKHHPDQNPKNVFESELRDHHKLGPILKEYKLCINSQSDIRTMLIQYPTAERLYCEANKTKPLELRIKPKCGLVEIDIPLNIHQSFDKEKGIEYGQALRDSRVLQQGGSYGLAGGMGIGSRPIKDSKSANKPEGPSMEKLLENIDDANNKGHVMNKITLGGLIEPVKEGDPIYMVATFKDGTRSLEDSNCRI